MRRGDSGMEGLLNFRISINETSTLSYHIIIIISIDRKKALRNLTFNFDPKLIAS